jgi:hypothetical protein
MIPQFLPEDEESKLIHLIEECSELIKAASTVLRFGMGSTTKNSKLNSVCLLDEIMDVGMAMDEVRKILPRPSDRLMEDTVYQWFKNSTTRQQEEFLTTNFDNLVVFMNPLGQQIINYFNLWHYNWEKRIVNNVYMSVEHPEAVALRIIENVWRKLQDAS